MSIFPELFDSFVSTSLVRRAIGNKHITIQVVDPREFSSEKHKQVDDAPYGGGAGLVLMAEPIIEAIKVSTAQGNSSNRIGVIMVNPSEHIFRQSTAHKLADEYDTLVFVTGRYEGIDHRVSLWCKDTFGKDYYELSLGQFVTLGGELPAMTMTEAVVRLIPGVIKEQESRDKESYRPDQGEINIEHPQYTRPQEVEGYTIPEVLLSGNHAAIEQRRQDMTKNGS